jgi:predicted component of type VI protein secretion system
MVLDTRNGHDSNVIKEFNESTKGMDDYGLLEFILVRWADDNDLKSIIEELKSNI